MIELVLNKFIYNFKIKNIINILLYLLIEDFFRLRLE